MVQKCGFYECPGSYFKQQNKQLKKEMENGEDKKKKDCEKYLHIMLSSRGIEWLGENQTYRIFINSKHQTEKKIRQVFVIYR